MIGLKNREGDRDADDHAGLGAMQRNEHRGAFLGR